MTEPPVASLQNPKHNQAEPSAWVTRWASSIPAGAEVLDFACGSGRHARWLAMAGFRVLALDRDAQALGGLAGIANIHTLQADVEDGIWPLAGQRFDAVVVTNYLHRPRFGELLECVKPGGILIYETFMQGNERFGRPSNPDFLLTPGELKQRLAGQFEMLGFEEGEVAVPRPAVIQRVCGQRQGRRPGSV